MRITYDKETDALYIRLVEGRHECRTLRLTDEIALNIGEKEMLIGIEILDAREILSDKSGNLPPLILENVPFQIV